MSDVVEETFDASLVVRGYWHGDREVIDRKGSVVRVRCRCGSEGSMRVDFIARGWGKRCPACAASWRSGRVGRSKTLSLRSLKKRHLEIVDASHERPRCRAECRDAPRPCPFVGCKHHLYLDVAASGAIVVNTPGELEDMPETCALDVAERGGVVLGDVGDLLGVSRERVRQIEHRALGKLRAISLHDRTLQDLNEWVGERMAADDAELRAW